MTFRFCAGLFLARLLPALAVCLFSGIALAQAAENSHDFDALLPVLAAQVAEARARIEAAPVFTTDYPDLTINQAYRVQSEAVRRSLSQSNDSVAGFKGGLTAKAAMTRFNVQEPVIGVLFASGRHQAGGEVVAVSRRAFVKPMVETELGFVFAKPVTTQLESIAALKQHLAGIAPVVELPDMGFAPGTAFTAVDLIANNVIARQFIIGQLQAPRDDINQLEVQLLCDDRKLHQARAEQAMGDQWQALLWLSNRIVAAGWQIRPGQVVITGALGGMKAAEDCLYRAQFAELGSLQFRFSDGGVKPADSVE